MSIFATLNCTSRSQTQVGHLSCDASLMHDTVASRVTDNCPLVPSRGRADDSLRRDVLINDLTCRITMYVSTDEAIMQVQRDTLRLLQRLY